MNITRFVMSLPIWCVMQSHGVKHRQKLLYIIWYFKMKLKYKTSKIWKLFSFSMICGNKKANLYRTNKSMHVIMINMQWLEQPLCNVTFTKNVICNCEWFTQVWYNVCKPLCKCNSHHTTYAWYRNSWTWNWNIYHEIWESYTCDKT
jgi:hypothetical protein